MNDSMDPKAPHVNSVLFGENTGSVSGLSGNWRDFFPEIVGHSPEIQNVLETVYKIAGSDSAVLVYGESGTGKELIASAIHRLSNRSSRQFVPINCSAIPENLLESELFGHEKGAFTGAHVRRPGHFEVADGGTIFLDEIGDMPLRLQAKLLRVLQEKQYTAVGGHLLKKANVRIVAATNIDLHEAIRDGRFRLDLFYRLNVLPVVLPPLRERQDDVVALLHHFLDKANRIHNVSRPCFLSREAIAVLAAYDWPGNIRELQNLIERLVVMIDGGEIKVEHLPPEYRESGYFRLEHGSNPTTESIVPAALNHVLPTSKVTYPESHGILPDAGINLPKYIEDLENKMILDALQRTNQNKNQAAKLLGLNRTTLVERIKKRKILLPDHSSKVD